VTKPAFAKPACAQPEILLPSPKNSRIIKYNFENVYLLSPAICFSILTPGCFAILFASIKMAPLAGKISREEWERYDDIIHNLYHVRGLPLHSEKGDPSVLQIMRDEHRFSAR
jgi:hypothetical protein